MNNPPQANAAPPAAPQAPAAQQGPAPAMPQAPTTDGAAQPQPAPPPKRSRAPKGPIERSAVRAPAGAPALLEIAAAIPFHTEQRRSVNYYIPDAHMLFHVLGICDYLMNTTHRFLQSSPAWLPIVSQLYIAILWNFHILSVYVESGYGTHFGPIVRELIEHLRLDECVIPGPLVPFFESIASVNGPFDWIGDIVAGLPEVDKLFNHANNNRPKSQNFRSLVHPVALLDQLIHFATWQIPANQSIYANFEWYHNIFRVTSDNLAELRRFRMTSSSAGSLFSSQAQVESARGFWNAALTDYVRFNGPDDPIDDYYKFLGFRNPNNLAQISFMQQISIVMGKYSAFFNGSTSLKAISPIGLGASVAVGRPMSSTPARDWLYPRGYPRAFLSSRFQPIHEIPTGLYISFTHADHTAEEVAEQYAIISHVNIDWSAELETQHGHEQLAFSGSHEGDFWTMMPHRIASMVRVKNHYAQIISTRYHQSVANRTE